MALVNIEFLLESGSPVEPIAGEECIPRANQPGAAAKTVSLRYFRERDLECNSGCNFLQWFWHATAVAHGSKEIVRLLWLYVVSASQIPRLSLDKKACLAAGEARS